MKEIVKEIFKETLKEMNSLTWKQRLIVIYFTLSFLLLFVSDGTPLWVIALIVINFANSVRLTKKLPIK
ncbi:MAG TPA: hypothetical protein PK285_11535 [Bacteroidales bacterium]|jgi:hypothetical protein|nr:hypothetical protein [Bacteroidales bacterium]